MAAPGRREGSPGGPRRHRFRSAGELVRGFWRGTGAGEDRLAILSAVWDREVGALRTQWMLEAVRGGTLHVKVRSAASAQELAMRSREILRNLNKHFRTPWIRDLRFRVGG